MLKMEIREEKDFPISNLVELYNSVGWESAKVPERLQRALRGSDTVFSVWEGKRLVGLINAIDDGEMTAYIHYLLVHPEYQKKGVGKMLVDKMKEHYKEYVYRILIAETPANIGFYESCGFEKGGASAMYLTTF